MPASSLLPRALVAFLLLFLSSLLCAQGSELFTFKAEALNDARGVALDEVPWRYMAGDDAAWAVKDYDDSNWQLITNEQMGRRESAG